MVLNLLILVCGTSFAYLFGTRWLGLSPTALREGLSRLAESVGVAVVFVVVNVTGVTIFVLVSRATGRFVPFDLATDLNLIVLSLLQAAAFQLWRYSSRERTKDEAV
jgi:mannose/fructose/N-acetylgalactosamine-specific phosphotransferase system component IID